MLPTLKGKKSVNAIINAKTLKNRILDFVFLNNPKLFKECLEDLKNGGKGIRLAQNY